MTDRTLEKSIELKKLISKLIEYKNDMEAAMNPDSARKLNSISFNNTHGGSIAELNAKHPFDVKDISVELQYVEETFLHTMEMSVSMITLAINKALDSLEKEFTNLKIEKDE